VTVLYGNTRPEKLVITLTGHVNPIPMGVLAVNPRKIDLGKIKVNFATEFGITMENKGDAPMVVVRLVCYLDYILIHSNARNVTKKGYKVVVVASVSES